MKVFHVKAGLDNHERTLVESVQPWREISSSRITAKILLTFSNNFVPRTAAQSSKRGKERDFKGATLVFEVRIRLDVAF